VADRRDLVRVSRFSQDFTKFSIGMGSYIPSEQQGNSLRTIEHRIRSIENLDRILPLFPMIPVGSGEVLGGYQTRFSSPLNQG
jgi:hypothetical protein